MRNSLLTQYLGVVELLIVPTPMARLLVYGSLVGLTVSFVSYLLSIKLLMVIGYSFFMVYGLSFIWLYMQLNLILSSKTLRLCGNLINRLMILCIAATCLLLLIFIPNWAEFLSGWLQYLAAFSSSFFIFSVFFLLANTRLNILSVVMWPFALLSSIRVHKDYIPQLHLLVLYDPLVTTIVSVFGTLILWVIINNTWKKSVPDRLRFSGFDGDGGFKKPSTEPIFIHPVLRELPKNFNSLLVVITERPRYFLSVTSWAFLDLLAIFLFELVIMESDNGEVSPVWLVVPLWFVVGYVVNIQSNSLKSIRKIWLLQGNGRDYIKKSLSKIINIAVMLMVSPLILFLGFHYYLVGNIDLPVIVNCALAFAAVVMSGYVSLVYSDVPVPWKVYIRSTPMLFFCAATAMISFVALSATVLVAIFVFALLITLAAQTVFLRRRQNIDLQDIAR